MTRRNLILLLTLASAAAILGAWGFQYIGGYAPCKLCYQQRYPHWLAMGAGILALAVGWRFLPWIGALGAATTSAIGFFHSGVERKWWDGPSSCSGGDIGALSTDALMEQIMSAPLVRCDEIPWEMFGISMANMNAVGSLLLAALWVVAARRTS